jgi:hypothetical protein
MEWINSASLNPCDELKGSSVVDKLEETIADNLQQAKH